MSKVDDILGNNEKTSYRPKYNNSNNWKEQQAKDRQQAYDTIEKMSFAVKLNSDKFKQYLDIQSRFQKYSVGNCFLIQSKEPNATHFKDKKSWKELGIELKNNPRSFQILEPSKSESSGRVYWNPKTVYDISQTKEEQQNSFYEYSNKELLTAFINNCFAEIKVVNELPDETVSSKYDKDTNILYVCRGMERELLFQSLSQELASIEMRQESESEYKEFKGYCISYMLCKKYGIDVSNYDFDRLPDEIRTLTSSKDIRNELDSIRISYEKINDRIAEHFEKSNKEQDKGKKQKIQER